MKTITEFVKEFVVTFLRANAEGAKFEFGHPAPEFIRIPDQEQV